MASPAPTITPPALAVAGDQPVVGVHRDAGRRVRVPHRARGDGRLRLGRVRQPPRSYDLSLQVDGTYTFRVHSVDAAGKRAQRRPPHLPARPQPPRGPDVGSEPPAESSTPTSVVVVHRRARLAVSVPLTPGATAVSAWAACSARRRRPLSRAGRRLYVPDARHRRGRQHRRASPRYTLDPRAERTDDHERARRRRHARPRRGRSRPSPARRRLPPAARRHRRQRLGALHGTHTLDLTGEVDGTYMFRVRAIDAAVNTGADSTSPTCSTAAPNAPRFTGGPSGPTNGSTPPGPSPPRPAPPSPAASSAARRSSTTGRRASARAPTTWPAARRDVHLARPRDRRRAQHGPEATRIFTLDRGAPAPPSSSGPNAPSDATPTTASPPSRGRRQCRIERGATVVSDWAACTTPHTSARRAARRHVHLPRPGDRPAGNTGADARATRSTAAPAPPTITGGPERRDQDREPSWRSRPPPARPAVPDRARGDPRQDWTSCTRPYTATSPPRSTAPTPSAARARRRRERQRRPDAFLRARSRAAGRADDHRGAARDRRPPAVLVLHQRGRRERLCRLERGATVVSDWAPAPTPRATTSPPRSMASTRSASVRPIRRATPAPPPSGPTSSTVPLRRRRR